MTGVRQLSILNNIDMQTFKANYAVCVSAWSAGFACLVYNIAIYPVLINTDAYYHYGGSYSCSKDSDIYAILDL